jgi:nucleoside-diphosphate-sugar epimerase
VLVTGANGFVGRAVRQALSAAEVPLRSVVRDRGSLPGTLPGEEVVVAGDLGPETDWERALNGTDAVVHLAARVHVLKESSEDPYAEFHKTNVLGARRLAREASAAGVKRLVYVSSVKANGEATSPDRPFTENDEPAPQDDYGRSKLEAERVLGTVAEETGLEVVVLRPPLVYGPGVKANFLRLLRLVDLGVPLPFGAVRNRRSLVYVGNLADAVLTCLRCPEAAGETFLVSDGEDASTAELMRRIAHSLRRPVRLLPVPPGLMWAAARTAGAASVAESVLGSLAVDSSRIRDRLRWAPPYSMGEGLEHTARWYRTAKAKDGL